MAIEVIEDIIDGLSLTQANGKYNGTRTFCITGLVGEVPAAHRMATSLTPGLIGNIPAYADQWPGGVPCYVTSRTVAMKDPNTSTLTCQYGELPIEFQEEGAADPQLTIGTTIVEVQTNFDVNGNAIITRHDGVKEAVATVAKREALTSFVFERPEYGDPGDMSLEYVPSVNDAPVFGRADDAGSWLCTRITGRIVDATSNPNRYLVSYEFVRREAYPVKPAPTAEVITVEGWQTVVVENDSSGNPIQQKDWVYEADSNGKRTIAIVDLYKRKNFSQLLQVS